MPARHVLQVSSGDPQFHAQARSRALPFSRSSRSGASHFFTLCGTCTYQNVGRVKPFDLTFWNCLLFTKTLPVQDVWTNLSTLYGWILTVLPYFVSPQLLIGLTGLRNLGNTLLPECWHPGSVKLVRKFALIIISRQFKFTIYVVKYQHLYVPSKQNIDKSGCSWKELNINYKLMELSIVQYALLLAQTYSKLHESIFPLQSMPSWICTLLVYCIGNKRKYMYMKMKYFFPNFIHNTFL